MVATPEGSLTRARPNQGVRIPPGLVAVAAIGAAAAALIHFDLGGRAFVAAAFAAALVVLAAIDVERRIIPNRIVLPVAAIVLAGDIAAEPKQTREWIIAALAAGAGALVLALATRGGIGMGDVKLCLLLGAGLGWHVVDGLLVGMLAMFAGALVVLVRHGLEGRKETMPMGPFLALGALVALSFA
jgi:leader peptidase (prepilin peptidase)/N-methyltransferase